MIIVRWVVPHRHRRTDKDGRTTFRGITALCVASCGVLLWLPRDATRRARLRHAKSFVQCPSVCRSVSDVQVSCSHRLEYFENYFAAELLKAPALNDSNIGDIWSNGNTPNYGGMGVECRKPAISVKRFKIGPGLLWRTNRKSLMRFRFVTLYQNGWPWTAEPKRPLADY